MNKIKRFNSKQEVIGYIIKKFKNKSNVIVIQGSTAHKPLKNFSDIDFETYCLKKHRPHYEIVLVKNKPILITVYSQKYSAGKIIPPPSNVKVVYGKYNDKLLPDFSKDKWTMKEKVIRESQLAIDFIFKYIRSKDEFYLNAVQKRLNWN